MLGIVAPRFAAPQSAANGTSKRRRLSTLIILRISAKSSRGQRCYAHIRGLFWRKLGFTQRLALGPRPPPLGAPSALALLSALLNWSGGKRMRIGATWLILPVVVVAGVALMVNVDTSVLSCSFEATSTSTARYYAVVGVVATERNLAGSSLHQDTEWGNGCTIHDQLVVPRR